MQHLNFACSNHLNDITALGKSFRLFYSLQEINTALLHAAHAALL